jgi:hypothetical protein
MATTAHHRRADAGEGEGEETAEGSVMTATTFRQFM